MFVALWMLSACANSQADHLADTCSATADLYASLTTSASEGLEVINEDLKALTEAANRSGEPRVADAALRVRHSWGAFLTADDDARRDAHAATAGHAFQGLVDHCIDAGFPMPAKQ